MLVTQPVIEQSSAASSISCKGRPRIIGEGRAHQPREKGVFGWIFQTYEKAESKGRVCQAMLPNLNNLYDVKALGGL